MYPRRVGQLDHRGFFAGGTGRAWPACLAAIALLPPLAILTQTHTQEAAAPTAITPVNAKTWLGRSAEIEAFLKTAEVDRLENLKIGVTKPQRVYFTPGELVESAAWKPLKPGMYHGYWDSYKAEIGAYEIDKLLGLDMVPPAVERRIKGDLGAAILWVTPARMWTMDETGMPQTPEWRRQVVRMKMFDDLIGNIDRNPANLLVDPSWNLILIDHSRALTDEEYLPTHLSRIDTDLWAKMNAVTAESLTTAVGQWIGKTAIKAILARRAEMQKAIDELVKSKGEAAVLLPPLPPASQR